MHEADHSPQRKPLRGGGHGRDQMEDYSDDGEEDFGDSIDHEDYDDHVGRNDGFGAFHNPNAQVPRGAYGSEYEEDGGFDEENEHMNGELDSDS